MTLWDWFRRRPPPSAPGELVAEILADDEPLRVQAAMLGEPHEAVAEEEKQAVAPLFELGPKRKPPA